MRVLIGAALACFAVDIAVAQTMGATLANEGNWVLRTASESTAAGSACLLMPKAQSRIVIAKDHLDVTGLPRNSIFNYQYIIDDGSVSAPSFPTADMQNAGAITIAGADFSKILDGRRFRIRMLDRWHEAITEDVDLTGLRSLHQRMLDECE